VKVHTPSLTAQQTMQVLVAALLHDVDDHKYFSNNNKYENATMIMDQAKSMIHQTDQVVIKQLISFVSCSKNKNTVPDVVTNASDEDASPCCYWMLIPRWADRLEAVGTRGVVRCYQYNREHGEPLSSSHSPRPTTESEVWLYADPERFQRYDGNSTDMISHYYDKLLHVSRPPPDIVRNPYLQRMALLSSRELVEVCLRYGRTGVVDETYIQSLVVFS
jgi:uncharacterized protein